MDKQQELTLQGWRGGERDGWKEEGEKEGGMDGKREESKREGWKEEGE